MNEQPRSFGRATRGVAGTVTGTPTLAAPAPVVSDWQKPKEFALRRFLQIWLIAPLGLALLESAFAGTALLTPINLNFLWGMRGFGAAMGLIVGWLVLTQNDTELSMPRRIVALLVAPFLLGFAFDSIAWRAADWWHFTGSDAQWETARYPIKEVNHNRRGRNTIEIDPFQTGEAADIPVSAEQFRQLWLSGQGNCVEVQQRRNAAGAVEVKTDGRFTLQTPPRLEVGPCY